MTYSSNLTASITLDNNITTDDVINAQEANQDINITGVVGGNVKDGDTVTLTINEKEYTTVVANGSFSVAVAGAELVADLDSRIIAKIVTTDSSGNVAIDTDRASYTVDLTAPPPPTVIILETTEVDDEVMVFFALDEDTEIGDSLTITNPNGETEVITITHDMITDGVIRSYPQSSSGNTLAVKATVTDSAGNTSEEGADSITLENTNPTENEDIAVDIHQNITSDDNGMFAYKDYSKAESVALIQEASRLTAFTSEPWNKELKLPDGWKQLTADDLGVSHDLVDSEEFFLVASDKGAQMKVFGEYNDAGELTRINFNIRATNSASDILEYFKLNDRSDIDLYEPLLNSVKNYAQVHGLEGNDMLVTGFSLGGAVTNMIATEREKLADGFFADADYIAFAPPTICNDSDVILNFGYENDVVHRATGDAESFSDAVNGMNSGLRNPDNDYESSIDNLILFNDTYASSAWDLWAFSLTNSDSWNAHMEGEYVDTVNRVANSSFYEYTKQDSTVIVADLKNDTTRESTWIENLARKRIKPDETERELEAKTSAFLIGGDKADLITGGSNFDYIDGGLGNDIIKAGVGLDHIDGNQGMDELRLIGENKAETTANDWHAFKMADDTLFFVDKDGINLVEADNIELVSFQQGTNYNIDEISYQSEQLEGSEANDNLTGQTVFARAGDDVVLGTDADDVLHGGRGNDLLTALSGNDKLYGAEGDDVLVSGAGNDILVGGIGNDTFVIKEILGSDTIIDFNNDSGYTDKLVFSSDLFNNKAELTAKTAQDGNNVKITLDDDNYLTINNSNLADVLYNSSIAGAEDTDNTPTTDDNILHDANLSTDNDDIVVLDTLNGGMANLKKGADSLTVNLIRGEATINTSVEGDNEDNSIDTVSIGEMQGGTVNLGTDDVLTVTTKMTDGTVNTGSNAGNITIAEMTGGTINLGKSASDTLKIGKADGGTINFGEGDDTVTITDVIDDGLIDTLFVGTTDGYYSGKSFDTITIASEGNTLSGGQLTSIEKVDLGKGDTGNTLTMTGDEIYNNDGLVVDGDGNDTVNLVKYYDWIKADTAVDGYMQYSYDSWGARETILIDTDITVNII